jgi:hypothetical protein
LTVRARAAALLHSQRGVLPTLLSSLHQADDARAQGYSENVEIESAYLKVGARRSCTQVPATGANTLPKTQPTPPPLLPRRTPSHHPPPPNGPNPTSPQELQGQKDELMSKVGALRTDLGEWRRRLDSNLVNYKGEVRVRVCVCARRGWLWQRLAVVGRIVFDPAGSLVVISDRRQLNTDTRPSLQRPHHHQLETNLKPGRQAARRDQRRGRVPQGRVSGGQGGAEAAAGAEQRACQGVCVWVGCGWYEPGGWYVVALGVEGNQGACPTVESRSQQRTPTDSNRPTIHPPTAGGPNGGRAAVRPAVRPDHEMNTMTNAADSPCRCTTDAAGANDTTHATAARILLAPTARPAAPLCLTEPWFGFGFDL